MATAVSSMTSAAPVAHDAAAPLGIALYEQPGVHHTMLLLLYFAY